MPGFRAARVGEMLHKELAERLRLQIKDPRLGPISLTGVEVSGDLRRAVVTWLPLGGGEPSAEAVAALEEAGRRLRGPIGRALRLRNAPEFVFRVDRHLERAMKVSWLIDHLKEGAGASPGEE